MPNGDAVRAVLRGRVRDALARQGAAEPSARACVAAGEAVLGAVLAADARSRDTALDLLAADALVTLAFELAAGDPAALEATADDALRRIAALAPPSCG